MRNFQLLSNAVNVGPLLHQLTLHPELWNQNRLRTTHPGSPHHQVDDVLLRFQQFHNMQGVLDDCECEWFPAWDVLTEAHGIVWDLARMVRAERIGRVLISRLAAGREIAAHEDGGAVAEYYTRYQLPLQNESGSLFYCAGETVQMRAGEAWWFNNKLEHSVVNNSATDRISLIVDLKTR